jgi:hypothetical protein
MKIDNQSQSLITLAIGGYGDDMDAAADIIERIAQRELLESTEIPTEILHCTESDLIKAGFVRGRSLG